MTTFSTVSTLVDAVNDRVRAALLESLMAMPYSEFEALVRQLLIGVGYTNVYLTANGPDGGVDLTAEATVKLGAVRVLVQAKRQRRNVPVDVVRALRGCLGPGQHGLLVTTASFTAAAQAAASEDGKVPIWLVDGNQVIDILVQQGIGVRKRRPMLLELDAPGREETVSLGVTAKELGHDPLLYQSRYARTPRGRPIEVPISTHFMGRRAGMLPVFSTLAGAALRACPDVDYFAIRQHIVFAVGSERRRWVAVLVQVQTQRIVVCLRLPADTSNGVRLLPHRDKGWYMLRHKVYLTAPGDVDEEFRLWLQQAMRGLEVEPATTLVSLTDKKRSDRRSITSAEHRRRIVAIDSEILRPS